MNKTIFSLIFLLSFSFSFGQWSVLDTDPRYLKNKTNNHSYQPFTQAEWNASNFASAKDMQWFNDARYGMFISYGLSSYVNKDLSWPIIINHKMPDPSNGDYPDSAWQKTWPSLWKLEKFNAAEWVQIAKDAGMKYMVIIVKHHDGFHMWDTKFSDFKITNTPFKRDYLRELVDACHKAKMPIGIYYSQRDWYHPDYAPYDTTMVDRTPEPPFVIAKPGKELVQGPTHKKYIGYQYNVIRELLTNYGKIDIFWFDALWFGGMYTADMWDAENLTRMIRKLQPHIIINNRASVPGDYDTPEQRIGMYQSRPWESCMTLNGSWAFDREPPMKTTKTLIREMLAAAAGNGNVLLSWGAKFDGEFDQAQKDTLLNIGSWLKKYGIAYYGTKGGPWMPNRDFGAVYKNNKIYLYVFNWKPEGLLLPLMKDNAVSSISLLNVNEKAVWKMAGQNLQIMKPETPNDIVTLVAITLRKPVAAVMENNALSIFDDEAFGRKFFTKAINENDWNKNEYTIDLGKAENVTGIRIYESGKNITITTSSDGQSWQNAGEAVGDASDIPVTTFTTGAYVPGKFLRYIRLKTNNPSNLKLDLYLKQ